MRKRDTPAHVTLAEQAPALRISGSWGSSRAAAAPRGRTAALAAGLRQFLLVLALLVGFTIAVSLLYAKLTGSDAGRAITIGFYIVGASVVIGGSRTSLGLDLAAYPLGRQARPGPTTSGRAVPLAYGAALVAIAVALDAARDRF